MVYFKTFNTAVSIFFGILFLLFWSVFSDGCNFLRSKPDILTAVFALTCDPSTAVVKQCYYIFVNLSADEAAHQVMGLRRSPHCILM